MTGVFQCGLFQPNVFQSCAAVPVAAIGGTPFGKPRTRPFLYGLDDAPRRREQDFEAAMATSVAEAMSEEEWLEAELV